MRFMKLFDNKINKSVLAILCCGFISCGTYANPLVYIANPNPTVNLIEVEDPVRGDYPPYWIQNIEGLNYPSYICVSPDNLNAYVVTDGKIAIIDTVKTVQTDYIELRKDFTNHIRQLGISPDGKKLYIIGLNWDQALLATVDIASKTITNRLVLPEFQSKNNSSVPEALGITPDGKRAIVLLKQKDRDPMNSALAVIDLDNQKVLDVIKLPGVGHRLVMTPDGKKAYIPIHDGGYVPDYDNEGDDLLNSGDTIRNLVVIDLTTDTIKTTLPMVGVGDIAITNDGKKAYVLATDRITVVDTATDTASSFSIPGGKHHRIGVTPDGKKAFLTEYDEDGGNLMPVIDLTSQQELYTVGDRSPFSECIVFLNPPSAKKSHS